MNTSPEINEIVAALALAHLEFDPVSMSGDNKHLKSRYAKLVDIFNATSKPLAKHGIVLIQTDSVNEGNVVTTTRLVHKSGQWFESVLALRPKDMMPQTVGSCITYNRRFEAGAILGIAGEPDDDAETAQGRETEKEKELMQTVLDLRHEIGNLKSELDALKRKRPNTGGEKIFTKSDLHQVNWLQSQLKTANVHPDKFLEIINKLDGKNILVDLPILITEYKS